MLPEVRCTFKCADAGIQRVYDEAETKCRLNLKDFAGNRVLVEGGGYEKIWLETQPMGGEMYALRDMQAAVNNSLLFMKYQRADGRLPGSIQCVDGVLEPQFNKFQGFCFPEHALNLYYLTGRDDSWLDMLTDSLTRFDEYLWRTRHISGKGTLSSFCQFDTGEDNAVRYGDAPGPWEIETPPTDRSVVPMESMDVTSFSYACRATLAQICLLRGNVPDATRWQARAQQVADGLKRRLWDESRAAFFDRDKYGKRVDVLCHNTLRCMYWGSASRDMAQRFVTRHLLNKAEFWTALPLPSVAVNDPAFRNAVENNWSGQCEGLTYQRAMHALERYGFEWIVTELGYRFINNLIANDCAFAQQFDPFTGVASKVGFKSHKPVAPGSDEPFQDAYGPTMLAALGYIERMWGIGLRMGKVRFSAVRGLAFESTVEWNGHNYALASDGGRAHGSVDGREVFEVNCGVRVLTDEQGTVLRKLAIERNAVC